MTFSVELAKIQGQRLLEEDENSKLASFCISQGLPFSSEEENVCPTLPELLEGTSAYFKNLRTEIIKRMYKRKNQTYKISQ